MNIFSVFFTAFIVFLYGTINGQENADAITGIWMTPENQSAIQIYKNGNVYYGKIIWEAEPNDENGNPKKDCNNPDPNKRNVPIHGLVILKGLRYSGSNEWVKGTIYNPEDGNTYKVKACQPDENTLKLRGFFGVSLIGKTSVWRRQK